MESCCPDLTPFGLISDDAERYARGKEVVVSTRQELQVRFSCRAWMAQFLQNYIRTQLSRRDAHTLARSDLEGLQLPGGWNGDA